MAMTDADKALVREAAREIIQEIGPDIAAKAAWTVIDKHIETCPVRAEVETRELRGRVGMLKLVIAVLLMALFGGAAGSIAIKLIALI